MFAYQCDVCSSRELYDLASLWIGLAVAAGLVCPLRFSPRVPDTIQMDLNMAGYRI